jgi:glucose/arabinose dehydrogenase
MRQPAPARIITLAFTFMVLLSATSLAGCVSGGSKKPQQAGDATAAATAAAASPSPKPAASPSSVSSPAPAGESVEVTGIVGSVNAGTRTIQIERRSGASVTKISVGISTVIRRATGGTATLSQIKPSDRIIASGTLSDRRDVLVAAEITIQEVVPGSSPGG